MGTTNRTARNIKKALYFSLKEKYGFEEKDKTNEMLKIHGLDDAKFDFVNFVNTLINENLNDVSIDSNSNKNEKTVEGVQQEAIAPVKKLVGYDYLYRKMKSLYGKKEAKRLSGEMYDLSLGLADSTNILRVYCWSLEASKLVTIGRPFGQLHSKPCKRVSSYISSLCESIHQLSSHLAGAIAIGSFFLDVSHLSLYKEGYDLRELKTNKRFRKRLENEFQQCIHSLNHLSRNGIESCFSNISIFDRIKLRVFIKEMSWYFPFEELPIDKPNIENEEELNLFYENYIVDYIIEVQNIFLNLFDKGDPLKGGAPYRFPIVTINLSKTIKEEKETIDDVKFLRDICKRDIYKYNIFTSEGTKVCSCCFDGNQKVLIKSIDEIFYIPFKDVDNLNMPYEKKINTRIFHNGFWVKGKIVKIPIENKTMYKIITSNNKEVIITGDHIFPTIEGDKEVRNLTEEDFIIFNKNKLNAVNEQDLKLTYEQGILIGTYLGDGSKYKHKSCESYKIDLSLNEEKYNKLYPLLKKALKDFSIEEEIKLGTPYNKVYPVKIKGKKLYEKISYWVKGNYGHEKELNLNCLLQSKDFRQGILDGYYITDGGNSNRIYTTSPKLAEHIEILLNSLGIQSIIDVSDRTDKKVVTRGKEFNIGFVLYCIRFYYPKRKMKDVYKTRNNFIGFKIKSIEKIENYEEKYVYCFEMEDKSDPYFTLPNGIISHNCRLINDSDMLEFASQSNSFGAGSSISLGSHRVCTINFVRIALEATKELMVEKEDYRLTLKNKFFNILNSRIEDTIKILKAHKDLLKDLIDKGLQPFFNYGWLNLNRMFSTVGIIGVYETAKILKEFEIEDNIEKDILIFLNKKVSEVSKKYGIFSNIEQIPAESYAVRFAEADRVIFGKESQPYELYSNQFIPLWEEATLWERLDKDGMYNKLITGGGIVHAQIGEKVTPKQAEKIIKYAVNAGAEHFALNAVYSECENGHCLFGKSDICKECGGKIIEQYSRVVGFFVPVSSFNKTRREWEFPKRTFVNLD